MSLVIFFFMCVKIRILVFIVIFMVNMILVILGNDSVVLGMMDMIVISNNKFINSVVFVISLNSL